MTRQKFVSLPGAYKKSVLLRCASFIAERSNSLFRVMLYELDGFYVEIYFLRWSKKPFLYNTFRSTDRLNPYLRQIDLSSLTEGLLVRD
jgi:hypothetical protein